MYGCEACKVTKTEAKKLDTFQYMCMKHILRINKGGPDHLPPTNPGNHRKEQVMRSDVEDGTGLVT